MHLSHLCIDKATDQLFVVDRQGQIINANNAACLSLGYPREELLSLSFADIDSFLLPEVLGKLWKELEHSHSLHFESEHRKKDGRLVPVRIRSRLITLDGQECLCAIVKNPTEQQAGISEHQESIERFRMLFEYATVGMARVSIKGEFLQVNDAFCRIVGYSREEILAKTITIQQITHPEDSGWTLEHYQQLLAGQIPSFSIEKRCIHKQGAVIWVNLSVSLLRDPSGNPLYFIGTVLDITAAKRTEESSSLAGAVFAHTHDGIVITDLDGRIQKVNPAFVELTGYEEWEVLGQTPRVLNSGRHPPVFYAALWASLKSTGHWRGEIWNKNKNGEIHPRLMTISVIKDSSGTPIRYVGVFSDITKLKESEARLDFLAHHDPLTHLPNRRLLELRVEHALEIACRNRLSVGLLIIDLDNFKEVNDSLGHAAGDELLKAVALRLSKRLRKMDTIARLGGDEFAVLLENPVDRDAAGRVAQDLLDELAAPLSLADGAEIRAGASIGISLFPEHGHRYGDLMQHADAALYQAKSEGRRTFRYYANG